MLKGYTAGLALSSRESCCAETGPVQSYGSGGVRPEFWGKINISNTSIHYMQFVSRIFLLLIAPSCVFLRHVIVTLPFQLHGSLAFDTNSVPKFSNLGAI